MKPIAATITDQFGLKRITVIEVLPSQEPIVGELTYAVYIDNEGKMGTIYIDQLSNCHFKED